MQTSRRVVLFLIAAASVTACKPAAGVYRGGGLAVDSLKPAELVGVYRATLAGSFTLGDPTLSILVDPIYLPRSSGLVGGDTMPPDVVQALRNSRVVEGLCKIPIKASGMPLICQAEKPGYVARFSTPFQMPGDTVQVHLVVQEYAIRGSPVQQRLRFERAYYVTRNGDSWKAVREARLSAP